MGIPAKIFGIKPEDISAMANHAEKEANPLYPVPKLMTAKELEVFYYQIADWSENRYQPYKSKLYESLLHIFLK